MPYGTPSVETVECLHLRAHQGNLDTDKLGLNPEIDYEKPESWPPNFYEISIIVGGALDEEFYVVTDYEVNMADWIAESLRDDPNMVEGETWQVMVHEVMYEDAGILKYQVTDETVEGASAPTCPDADCGYGECSWLQGGVNGKCNVHGNGEGRCQKSEPLDDQGNLIGNKYRRI